MWLETDNGKLSYTFQFHWFYFLIIFSLNLRLTSLFLKFIFNFVIWINTNTFGTWLICLDKTHRFNIKLECFRCNWILSCLIIIFLFNDVSYLIILSHRLNLLDIFIYLFDISCVYKVFFFRLWWILFLIIYYLSFLFIIIVFCWGFYCFLRFMIFF